MHATYPSHIIPLEVFILTLPYLVNITSYIAPLYCDMAPEHLSDYMASYQEDLSTNCYHTDTKRKSCYYHDIKYTIHGPSNYNAIHFYSAMENVTLLPLSLNSDMTNKQTGDYSVQCYLEN
jgi:hypothetical protein